MIVLNEEAFIPYNLRALYPFAHQIIVVEGAIPPAAPFGNEIEYGLNGKNCLHFCPDDTKDLAEEVIDVTGSQSKIIHRAFPSDDTKQSKPNITLAKEELDWKPKIKLEEGLVKTIGYFEGFLSYELLSS